MANTLIRDSAHYQIMIYTFKYAPIVAGIPELDYRASSGLILEHFFNSDWEDLAPNRYCYCGNCDMCHAHDQWVDVATQIVALITESMNLNGLICLRDYEDELEVVVHLPDIVIYYP